MNLSIRCLTGCQQKRQKAAFVGQHELLWTWQSHQNGLDMWHSNTYTQRHKKGIFRPCGDISAGEHATGTNSQQAHVGDWCISQWEGVTFTLIRALMLPTCFIRWMCTPCGWSAGSQGGVTSRHNAEDVLFLTLWCLINISLTFLWHFWQDKKRKGKK